MADSSEERVTCSEAWRAVINAVVDTDLAVKAWLDSDQNDDDAEGCSSDGNNRTEEARTKPRPPDAAVLVVCGAKNTGKSTFSRLITNVLLESACQLNAVASSSSSDSALHSSILPSAIDHEPTAPSSNEALTKSQKRNNRKKARRRRNSKLSLSARSPGTIARATSPLVRRASSMESLGSQTDGDNEDDEDDGDDKDSNDEATETQPRVAFIETDIGQPEFTPTGLVSLHIIDRPVQGRPSSHQRPPELSFFIGDTSPKPRPSLFMESVRALAAHYNTHLRPLGIPLVVNTHGWVVGLGKNMLEAILHALHPTHVLQLQSPSKSHLNCLPQIIPGNPVTFTISPVQGVDALPKKPADQERFNGFAAYFTQQDPSQASFLAPSVGTVMTAMRPFRVPLRKLTIELLQDIAHTPSEAELLLLLNASLVGLCVGGSRYSPCLGLGIVRAVDYSTHDLYVLTPVPADRLQEVDTLVVGSQRFPLEYLYSDSRMVVASPYLACGVIDSGGQQKNRNLKRRRLD
jgi:polynucleotide 5'-hydroxyl-kinase GRC3/NOL9